MNSADSYVTVEEADAYFNTRVDVAAWQEADVPLKEQALLTAAAALERYQWVGVIADPSQPLAWPRVGSYFDPRAGYIVPLSGVPRGVKHAQMELAYHYINNDGVLDEGTSATKVQVGPIKVEGIVTASRSTSIVHQLVSPLLAKGSSNMWWRAN